MKALFLFFTFHLFTNPLFSQEWFVGQPKWTYEFNSFGVYGTEKLSIGVDTVINGIICKTIAHQKTEIDKYTLDTTIFNFNNYGYYSGNKVYFYSRIDDLFHLTYDFNLDVGDFFILDADYCEPDTFFINGISTIEVGGFELTVQTVENSLYPQSSYDIIEYIGYNGPLGYLDMNQRFDCSYTDPTPKPVCYKNYLFQYNLKDSGCFSLMEPQSILNPDVVSILPNPFHNEMKLWNKSQEKIIEIRVYTMNGIETIIYEPSTEGETITVEGLENLPSGIYVMKIKFIGGKHFNYKITKF